LRASASEFGDGGDFGGDQGTMSSLKARMNQSVNRACLNLGSVK